jgi:pimeloyl-ACP methyl ester carboxylesterase
MAVDGVVLVHGGMHDASCWQLTVPLLDTAAIAVDLPGRGKRPMNGERVTFARCAEAVLADADAAGFDRFLLVGHSMGGFTISTVGLLAPERVGRLAYVGALAPPLGVTTATVFGLPQRDDVADDELQHPMPEEISRAMFANDMDDAQWAIARQSLVPEPLSMFHEAMSAYATGIPTTYLKMVDDQPVPPARADEMIQQLGPAVDVRAIDAAHNVMLSQPALVASILDDLARRAD